MNSFQFRRWPMRSYSTWLSLSHFWACSKQCSPQTQSLSRVLVDQSLRMSATPCLQWWLVDVKTVKLESVQKPTAEMDRESYCTLARRPQTTNRSSVHFLTWFYASTSLIGNYGVSRKDEANLRNPPCGSLIPSCRMCCPPLPSNL